MKKIILFLSIILLIVSCGNSNEKMNFGDAKMVESMQFDAATSRKSKTTNQQLKKPQVNSQRKLIKTGNITFETKDIDVTRRIIIDLVNQNNGYVASDNQYKSDDRVSVTISIRIPADKFDSILDEIAKGVEKFDSKNIRISDVTEQFLDIEARLKTKKTLELKYLEILKRARTVREILDVERELGKLRSDIESTEGRLKYLQNQVSFSTLNITFYKQNSTSEASFIGKVSKAFKTGFENIKDFFLYMINIWPFIIILFLVFFYLRKRRLRTK
ncbi:MAG: DUF4349 domain-containing protein [Polaribacter sp.]|jgi:hypothetical protein|nr:DUF4349 domain-containing protein [Polaribacter sp.]MDG1953454.1 DUF4349 domain-containing protein [Polaribacter sp.]MDG2073296.1 DUF4349 domain-containing protein [Polaribacter sp.]